MNRGSWTKLFAVAIVIAVVSLTMWSFLSPKEEENPELVNMAGLETGDWFRYDITGTINGTAVHGSFEWSVYQAPNSVTWGLVNTTDQMLADVMAYWTVTNTGPQVGHGVIDTPFGTKNVVWTYDFFFAWSGFGLATISYWGTDPVAEYGFVVNGPDLHLDLLIVETSNERMVRENVDSFAWHDENGDEEYETRGGSWLNRGVIMGTKAYLADPGRMVFNITGDDADVFVFSMSNMVSMAEGGPFAYHLGATMLHMGTYAGETAIPTGLLIIYVREMGEDGGRYDFKIEPIET